MSLTRKLTSKTKQRCAAAALALAISPELWAVDLQATVNFDIASQPLVNALIEFSKQAKVQVMSSGVNLKRKDSAVALNGRYSLNDALKLLLGGTGLDFSSTGPNTIAVTTSVPANGATEKKNTAAVSIMHLAATGSVEDPDGVAAKKNQTKDPRSGEEVEEMVVEGERNKPEPFSTNNLDLTRTEDDPLPFTTFTAEDIKRSGAVSLNEFLHARLPQNFSDVITDETTPSGSGESRSAQVSMRGWTNRETVFLLNGRRIALQYRGTAQSSGSTSMPDLQGIPLGSIERVEILPSAGSAIYGANATGGIINIITRRDYRGGQLNLNYATPADANAPTRGADATYSVPSFWNTTVRLGASYNESEPLKVGDRSEITIERWRRLVMEREPTRLLSATAFPPFGSVPNVRTVTTTSAANLFGAGTPNFATVVPGSTGALGLAGFQRGTYNVELAERGGGRNQLSKDGYLGAVTANTVFNIGFDKKVTNHLDWSLDYRYSQNDVKVDSSGSISFSGSTSGATRVPAAAPMNPFGQDVYVALVDPRLAKPELSGTSKNFTWEMTSTLRAAFGDWRGFWDVGYSNNDNYSFYKNFVEPIGGWANAFLAGAYNPFVDLRAVAPASAAFYDSYVAQHETYRSSNSQYLSTLKAAGPILRLPKGNVQLTAGIEWSRFDRDDSTSIRSYVDSITGALRMPVGFTSNGFYDFDPYRTFVYTTSSAYAEVTAPMSFQKPLLEKLEIFASGRIDRRVADAFDPITNSRKPFQSRTLETVHAIGMRYGLLNGLTLRASQSVGFLPPYVSVASPSYSYLPGEQPYTETISDPRRPNGGVPSTIVLDYSKFIFGGNVDLRPETTVSKNFGVIVSPELLAGLRVSVDYIESLRNDAITGLSFQETVDAEDELPGRVLRGPSDGHPSGVGPIIRMDMRPINLNQIASRSVDFSLDKRFRDVLGGDLTLSMAATKNLSYKIQRSHSQPAVEQIRNVATTTFSQQIVWNGNGQLQWDGRRWSLGWSARYYDYLLVSLSNRTLQGSERVPWKINHDVFASYKVGTEEKGGRMQQMLAGTSITFGVKNLFDREPRFWAANTGRGVAPYDSIMGRSLWLQVRKNFE